jgi:hypothetical protein
MATYNNLPVYKASYDLLLQLFRSCQNMERDYKYTIGENLKKEVIELIINLYRANCREDRRSLIEAARENTEVIRLLIRLLCDLKQMKLDTFVGLNDKLENISKQLSYWLQSQKKAKTKQKVPGESPEGLLAFSESAG